MRFESLLNPVKFFFSGPKLRWIIDETTNSFKLNEIFIYFLYFYSVFSSPLLSSWTEKFKVSKVE